MFYCFLCESILDFDICSYSFLREHLLVKSFTIFSKYPFLEKDEGGLVSKNKDAFNFVLVFQKLNRLLSPNFKSEKHKFSILLDSSCKCWF